MAAIHDLIARIGDERLRERLFGRIQLIRVRKVAGASQQILRPQSNRAEMINKRC